MTVADIVLATWGFLVGFVGWASCFRLIEPISRWLAPLRAGATGAAVLIRVIVMTFLIAATISAIAIGPLIVLGGGGGSFRENSDWRTLLGVAFIGSLIGFFSYGVLQRFWGRDADAE